MATFNGTLNQDFLSGSIDADIITGGLGDDTIFGREGNDSLDGQEDSDILNGNQGNDTVRGNQGDDLVRGGQENDQLFGDGGNDTIYGDLGNDTGFGGDGNDILFGDRGLEANFSGNGSDILSGGQGNDTVFGLAGNDQLEGNQDNDVLNGNEGQDTIRGNEGNDTVRGGQDNDLLFGDAGSDVLFGDLGADTVIGGEGSDLFVIGRRFDVPGFRTTGGINIADADSFADFTKAEDLIQLIGGVTFEELNIFQGSGIYSNHTIIQDKFTGEFLAILQGVNASGINGNDFMPRGNALSPSSLLQFSTSNFSINEDGTTTAAVTITRTGSSSGVVSARVLLNGGNAVGGSSPLATPKDYDNTFITVNWADGDTAPKTIVVPIFNDTEIEGNETVNLSLDLLAANVTLGTQSTAVLTIIDNDTAPPPTNPEIEVLDNNTNISEGSSTVNFGVTTAGTDITKIFTVKNTGTAPLNLGAITLPNGFSLVSNFGSNTLAAGSQTNFSVKLNATDTGTPSGTLSFNSNDGDENPFVFTIQGTINPVPVPEIEVLDGVTNISDDTSAAIEFGTTTVGNPLLKTFTVNNTGNASLNLSGINLPAGFSLVGNFPSSIAANSNAIFQIQLDATFAGTTNGNLQFTNNDSDENPFNFPISGTVNLPTVSIAATDATAVETGGNTGTFRITRTGGTANALTVNLAIDSSSTVTSNTGGAFPFDYNFSVSSGSISGTDATRTLIIPAGQSFVDVTVTPNDDIHAEADETLRLNVAAGNYTIDAANHNATVTITANDTVVINTNDDASNYGLQEGSLRQALLNAIAFAGADTVSFNGAGASGTINLKFALPDLNGANANDTTIDGPGANLLTVQRSTAAGTPNFGIFTINFGVTAAFNGLTIANGDRTGGGPTNGGGISNNGGTVTISNSHITGNKAQTGGGIFNFGTMTVLNSTISDNSATFQVGGISSGTNGSNLTVINSTISGNIATGRYGGLLNGNIGTTTTLINSTITNNSAGIGEGGVYNPGGIVNARNTIIAGNTAPTNPDFNGTLTSQGYNLIGNTTGAAITGTTTGNITGVSANLGTLQNNGGSTPTHALVSGSPAINAGDPAFDPNAFTPPLNTDQRGTGFDRILQGRLDIGAFESNLIPSEIRGTKWNDLNNNRQRDFGEPGLAGWTIYLDQNNNGRLDVGEQSTTTDANGNYAFIGLSPGIYTVAEVRQRCWRQTFPGTFVNGSGTGGNILVSTNETIREYTQAGTAVSPAINIPYGAGSRPVTEDARDIIIDQNNLIYNYNGTFDPFLSTYNRSNSTWTHTTHPGWSTVANVSYGGIAKYQNFVYVTDMTTFGAGDTPSGIVRFDFSNNTSGRFADPQQYIDLTMGLDGVLYALRDDSSASGRTVDAYDPLTMNLLWTTTLANDARGIAVNENGDIFAASWDGNIRHFNCDGTQVNFRTSGTNNLTDIDVSFDGKLIVGSRFGQVIMTDESLASQTSFSAGGNETFVSFSTPQTPIAILNPTHTVNLSAGQIVNGIDFGAIALGH